MMYSDIEHWVFLLKKTSGVCDLTTWGNMVIVFQNKLFSQKKNGLQFSLLDLTMEKQNTVDGEVVIWLIWRFISNMGTKVIRLSPRVTTTLYCTPHCVCPLNNLSYLSDITNSIWCQNRVDTFRLSVWPACILINWVAASLISYTWHLKRNKS